MEDNVPGTLGSLDAFDVPAGPRFFETLGVQLIQGREFTFQEDERAPKVAIINQTVARDFFGTENPIGRRIGVHGPGDTIIVGVANHTKLREALDLPGSLKAGSTESARVNRWSLAPCLGCWSWLRCSPVTSPRAERLVSIRSRRLDASDG